MKGSIVKQWSSRTFLLFVHFLAAVAALCLFGTSAMGTGVDDVKAKKPKNAHQAYAIRDKNVDPKMHPARRARTQRDTAIKKKHDTQKFIRDVMAGEQPAGGAK